MRDFLHASVSFTASTEPTLPNYKQAQRSGGILSIVSSNCIGGSLVI